MPWAMVGFTDPSSLNALVVYSEDQFGGEPVVEVGIGVAVGDVGIDTDPYHWLGWDRVEWHERLKAGVEHFTQAAADVGQ